MALVETGDSSCRKSKDRNSNTSKLLEARQEGLTSHHGTQARLRGSKTEAIPDWVGGGSWGT